MNKQDLLAAINSGIPPNVDWKAGARRYLKALFKGHSRENLERYVFTKPLGAVPPQNPQAAIAENVGYLRNFTETVSLLGLPGGSRILDVACGGGWVSHWLLRMGYDAYGIDISEDFISLARQRILKDDVLNISDNTARSTFVVHDIEAEPLGGHLASTFDGAILESCLHHFFDPITALSNIATAMKQDGLVVIIEGENRGDAIKDDYLSVMRELDTLERPYKREHLVEVLKLAGLPEFEFVAPIPSWLSTRDPLHPYLVEHHGNIEKSLNYCVAAKTEQALNRVFPWREKLKTSGFYVTSTDSVGQLSG